MPSLRCRPAQPSGPPPTGRGTSAPQTLPSPTGPSPSRPLAEKLHPLPQTLRGAVRAPSLLREKHQQHQQYQRHPNSPRRLLREKHQQHQQYQRHPNSPQRRSTTSLSHHRMVCQCASILYQKIPSWRTIATSCAASQRHRTASSWPPSCACVPSCSRRRSCWTSAGASRSRYTISSPHPPGCARAPP